MVAGSSGQGSAVMVSEEERIRGLLRRYLSPRVAHSILRDPPIGMGAGSLATVSVLLCDLRGYSAFATHTPPVEVAAQLNEFLAEMTHVVFKYDGMLDKFTGDGLLAVFGVPYPQQDHAERAVQVALEMQACHTQLVEEWTSRNKHALALGVGIESGDVLAGHFGTVERSDYTVIGHAVNVAARLTAVASGGQILLGDGTRQAVASKIEVEHLGPAVLKNIGAVPAYRLLGLRPGAVAFCLECGLHLPEDSAFCSCGTPRYRALATPEGDDRLVTAVAVRSTLHRLPTPRTPQFIAVAGPYQGSSFPVAFPCAIGRDAFTNQLVLSLDSAVSRRHALLRQDDAGSIVVEDVGSRSGTLVNNAKVHSVVLQNGDVLTLGHTRLVVTGLQLISAGGIP